MDSTEEIAFEGARPSDEELAAIVAALRANVRRAERSAWRNAMRESVLDS